MANHPNRSKRGRPTLAPEDRKRTVTISLSPDVIAAYHALGPGKSLRVNEILRAALIKTD